MLIIKTIEEARQVVRQWRKEGKSVGFCPTMGYLHEGHLSLMRASQKDNDKTIASVFVNPMQFGPSEDLAKYPRDMERDCAMMESLGVDMVFAPEPSEMYANDFCSFVDMSVVSETLCGKSRPVMFRGVCTVLTKLIHILDPDKMYMGKKDAQQLAVVRRMVRDLNFDLEVVGCPTAREEDGLAMSSRNSYLSEELAFAQRANSYSPYTVVYQTKDVTLSNSIEYTVDQVDIVAGFDLQVKATLPDYVYDLYDDGAVRLAGDPRGDRGLHGPRRHDRKTCL